MVIAFKGRQDTGFIFL